MSGSGVEGAAVRRSRPRRRCVWVAVGLVLVVAVLALVKLGLGLSPARPAKLVALRLLREVYPYLALSAFAAGGGFAGWLAWSRRRGRRAPVAARGLLLCVAVVSGLLLVEAGSGVWLWRAHRTPTLAGKAERARPGRAADPPVSKFDVEKPVERALPEALPEGAKDEVYLVVLGESSAAGFPYAQKLSVGKIVEWQLNRLIPSKRFRVDVLADSGSHLEWQYHKLASLARRPDGILVFCGHNEFYSRHGWQHEVPYYRDGPPPRASLADRAARYSPLLRLVGETIAAVEVSLPPEAVPRPLVDAPSFTAEERVERLADFRRRLTRIVEYAERVGAVPILVPPPGNDAGFEPSRSLLPPETPWPRREAFAEAVHAARRLEFTDVDGSIAAYRSLIESQPGFAECHFRLARLLEIRNRTDEAYRHYVAARDLDGLPLRCQTAFQDVYRELGRRPGAVLVDGQQLFHARNPGGQLDDHLFNDAMHPSFEGHVALAEGILAGLKARGAFGWPAAVAAPSIDLRECAAHFGMDQAQWEAVCRFASRFYAVAAPLRFDRAEREAKQSRYEAWAEKLAAGQSPESLRAPGLGLEPVGEANP